MDASRQEARDWWRTDIIDIEPDKINIRGYPIQQLLGQVTFAEMIWLSIRGDLPTRAQARLFEAMLVAGIDHGPHAPTIAIARMSITCGIGINNAMASAANVMGDVHGGAGEQLMEIFAAIKERMAAGETIVDATAVVIDDYRTNVTKYIPGYGHRFHTHDPREVPSLAIVDAAVEAGTISGEITAIARQIQAHLKHRSGRHITLNVDGTGAIILGELGFAPMLGRGLFVLSRSVGILSHAWEQHQQGGRNKGPIPKSFLYTYSGEPERDVPTERE